ncbi:MAG: hypothetical protein IPP86_00220 [Bacteroidetes bacterium]|nr:hypothetical protein [Bacteroidota bacterium]
MARNSTSFNVERAKLAKQKAKPRGPDKRNKLARELITSLIESEYDNILAAIAKLRRRSPARYLDIMISLFEYAIPKLSRAELEVNSTAEQILTIVVPNEDTRLEIEKLKASVQHPPTQGSQQTVIGPTVE